MMDFNEMLDLHAGLVKLECSRFIVRANDPRIEWDDAHQVALMTLLRCCELYDSNRGARFSTYLGSALRKSLANFLRQSSPRIRTGTNGNSWQKVSVVSFDAMSIHQQEQALLGYSIFDEDEAA